MTYRGTHNIADSQKTPQPLFTGILAITGDVLRSSVDFGGGLVSSTRYWPAREPVAPILRYCDRLPAPREN